MRHLTDYKFVFFMIITAVLLSGCNAGSDTSTSTAGSPGGIIVSPTDPDPVIDPVAVKSASLNWTPPTQKVNGDSLFDGELTGFQIYFGPIDDPLANVIIIDSPYVTSYTINNLKAGNYSFRLVAVDHMGRTSVFSNSITTSIS